MDEIVVLIIIVILAVLISPYVFIQSLRKDVKTLRSRLTVVEAHLTSTRASKSDDTPHSIPLTTSIPTTGQRQVVPTQKAPLKQPDKIEPLDKVQPAPPRPASATSQLAARLISHAKANWLAWMATLSIALGGVFMVQYSIQQGLLSPIWRVISTIALGVILLAGSVVVERRMVRAVQDTFHPANILAAGGVSALFSAAFAAHFLYGFTGPILGFATMGAVSFVAIFGGLRNGALLTWFGAFGGFITPLLINGGDSSPVLLGYLLLVAAACFIIDRLWHGIYLSWITLGVALGWGAILITQSTPNELVLMFTSPYLTAIALLACIIGRIGRTEITLPQTTNLRDWITIPQVFEVTALILAGIAIFAPAQTGLYAQNAGLASIFALFAFAVLTDRQTNRYAPAVLALPLIGLGLAATLGQFGFVHTADYVKSLPTPLALYMSATCALGMWYVWGRLHQGAQLLVWSLFGALLVPVHLVTYWTLVRRMAFIQDLTWALLALCAAAPMIWLAERLMKQRATLPSHVFGLFVLSAIGLIALAAGFSLSGAPMTIAFAVIAYAAVRLDQRFDIPIMALAVQGAAILTTGRLAVYPGFSYTVTAPAYDVYLSFAGVIALFWLTSRTLRNREWPLTKGVSETAWMSLTAIALTITFGRELESDGAIWGAIVTTWLILAFVQIYRAGIAQSLRRLRLALAAIYSLIAFAILMILLIFVNPLDYTSVYEGAILIINVTFVQFFLPGLVLTAGSLFAARWIKLRWLHLFWRISGSLLIAFYTALQIRLFWQGRFSANGVMTEELYSYTIAMLIAAVGTILAGIWLQRANVQKLGMGLIGLTALKVFFIDVSGLGGLARAGSFIVLGAVMFGLVTLYRYLDSKKPATDSTADSADTTPN